MITAQDNAILLNQAEQFNPEAFQHGYNDAAQRKNDDVQTLNDNEQTKVLNSRDKTEELYGQGDLNGALQNAQANGDREYMNSILNQMNQNRSIMGNMANHLKSLPQEQRQQALSNIQPQLKQMGIGDIPLDDASLSTMAVWATPTAEQNKLGIDQQNANTQSQDVNNRGGYYQGEIQNQQQHNNIDQQQVNDTSAINQFNSRKVMLSPGEQMTMLNTGPGPTSGTLADRNNNPANLTYAGQPGARPGAGGYAYFANPQDGVNANANQLNLDINKHGYNTINTLIPHWASTSTPEDQRAYIINTSRALGKRPDEQLTTQDIPKILPVMSKIEGYHSPVNVMPTSPNLNQPGIQTYNSPGVGQVIANVPAVKQPEQTDTQRKQAQYAANMDDSIKNIVKDITNNGNPNLSTTELVNLLGPNFANTIGQSGINDLNRHFDLFVDAYGRSESGAAIGKDEYQAMIKRVKILPTDSPQTVASKINQMREIQDEVAKTSIPGGVVSPYRTESTNSNVQTSPTRSDQVGLQQGITSHDPAKIREFIQKHGYNNYMKYSNMGAN